MFSCCRCIFSVGGDGALHVLDDADATGYIKPPTTRHRASRNPPLSRTSTPSAAWGKGGLTRPCSRASFIAPPSTPGTRRSSATVRHGEAYKPGPNLDGANGRPTGGGLGIREVTGHVTDESEANLRHANGRRRESETVKDRAKNDGDLLDVGVAQEGLEIAMGGSGGGKRGGGRSVLLRQIIFASSSNSDVNEEGTECDVQETKRFTHHNSNIPPVHHPNDQDPGTARHAAGYAVNHRPTGASLGSKEPNHPFATNVEQLETSTTRVGLTFDGAGLGWGGGVRVGSYRVESQTLPEHDGSNCLHRHGSSVDMPGGIAPTIECMNEESASSAGSGRYFGASSAPSTSVRLLKFARVAQTLLPFSGLGQAPGKCATVEEKEGTHPASVLSHQTYDITGYAADDHLNLIGTATTSDSDSVETINSDVNVPAHRLYDNAPSSADQKGKQRAHEDPEEQSASSSVHLWDAERMSLVATLLFPNPALTRDLAISSTATCTATAAVTLLPSDPASGEIPTAANANEGKPAIVAAAKRDKQGPIPTADNTGAPSRAELPDTPPSTADAVSIPAASHSGAGRGLSRPTLVTALTFLSPYPLLAGASTAGTVALWRVTDGVCVQAILLSADGPLPKRRRSLDATPAGTFDADEEHFTCMARGTYSPPGGEETTVIYVGNGRGDILAAHLSLSDLVTLSGNGEGPVPCQRRVNHNPNRAVRVRLTPRTASGSLRDACRAQAAHTGLVGGLSIDGMGEGDSWACTEGPRDMDEGRRTVAGTYNFAAPSSRFKLAWVAHAAAVSSVSWIDSPPSLLSSSADGLAKIWAPDGSTLLGQLDINNKRPELSPFAEGRHEWLFIPGAPANQQQDNYCRTGTATPGKKTANDGTATRKQGGEGSTSGDNDVWSDIGGGVDGELGAVNMATPGAGARGWSSGANRGQPRRRQGHQDEEEDGEGPIPAGEDGKTCHSPDSIRFPTFTPSGKETSRPTRASTAPNATESTATERGVKARSALGSGTRSRPNTPKSSLKGATQSDAGVRGDTPEPAWMSGWDGMTRQLKAFEEKLEASSSGSKMKDENANNGGPLPTSTSKGGRKVPLHGKRWRTMSAPSCGEGNGRGRYFGEDSLYPRREAGSIRVGVRKGMKGYVVPRPGTAEDAALKRLAIKGATGVVAKDKATGRPRNKVPASRSLENSLARPRSDYFPSSKSGNKGLSVITTTRPGPDGTATPASANAAAGGTTKGLPSVAILAGSRNGRLISSGITIAGDKERGGFNVEVARAAARDVIDKESAAHPPTNDEARLGNDWRDEKGSRNHQRSRSLRQGGRAAVPRGGGASSWGWNQEKNARSDRKPLGRPPGGKSASGSHRQRTSNTPSNRQKPRTTGGSDGNVGTSVGHTYGSGSFPAPSCGGGSCDSVVSGCGSSSVVVTEGPSGKGALAGGAVVGGGGGNMQGLSAESVRWWSSRGSSRSSSRLYRAQGGARGGQGETIRTLVHMGLL